jgi:hypothetical protein
MRAITVRRIVVKRSIVISVLFFACIAKSGRAGTVYAISPDGSAVVRLTPEASVSASSLNLALLPSGYAATTDSSGSLSVTGYDAGFRSGNGGAQFTALYNTGLEASSNLNWIQVINTNDPLGNSTPPYLDNAANTSQPFYSFTQENRDSTLPGNQLNFYDFSTRSPSDLSSTDPITWNADLYPVIASSSGNALTVENGTTWGWTMKKATVGETSAVFIDPTPESNPVLSGVGTNEFHWGSGDWSALGFVGSHFDTSPDTPFDLGTLYFYNGSIQSGTGADGIDFDLKIAFDNVPEKNFYLNTEFGLVNTPNTSDPIASADYVTIGDYGYTFNVLEGHWATVDIFAELTTDLSGYPTEIGGADSPISTGLFDPSPNYELTIVGLGSPSSFGFTTDTVPEPVGFPLVASALFLLLCLSRKRLI